MSVVRTPPRERRVPKNASISDKEDLNSAPNTSLQQSTMQKAESETKEDDRSDRNLSVDVDVSGVGCSSILQDKEVSERSLRRNVGKLDDSVFQPFGPSSRHNSEDGGSSSDREAICTGGPGKKICNELVKDDQQGLQCDGCSLWYHAPCQKVTKPAITALRKFVEMGVCWFCSRCRPSISTEVGKSCCEAKMDTLNKKMSGIEESLQHHMKLMEKALKEQEQNISDQTRLIERTIKMEHDQKQTSFAEIVKKSCKDVTKEVTTKLD